MPPEGFEPPCKADDEIRFEVFNQYISRLYCRWGAAAREFCAIKMCLKAQNISYTRPPMVSIFLYLVVKMQVAKIGFPNFNYIRKTYLEENLIHI